MVLTIILTSAVIVIGLLKTFLHNNQKSIEQNFEEMKNWFAIPSVLNAPEVTTVRAPDEVVADKIIEVSSDNENSTFYDDEEYVNDNNIDPFIEQNTLTKKSIVYKSVTKRMTLVKIY